MSEATPHMIIEYDPIDPTRVTLRRVTQQEAMQVWIENNLYLFEPFSIDPLAIEEARQAVGAMQAAESGEPSTEHQRAHERSKADRRRKSRRGKYKWGGAIDE